MTTTTAEVETLAALLRRFSGDPELVAQALLSHGVVLYCTHPRLARSIKANDDRPWEEHYAECPGCGNVSWGAEPPEMYPQRLAGIDPREPVSP